MLYRENVSMFWISFNNCYDVNVKCNNYVLYIKLLGFILNYVLALDKLPLNGLWILLIILGPFYVYLILFYKTKFRRFEME